LIIQPHLGKDVTTGGNTTPADFLSAMYAAGSSLAVVQTSDFRPQSAPLEAFFLFNSHTGMSVLSLTLT
jgi:hypothetical protein